MLALPIARRELLVLSRAWMTWKNRIGVSVLVLGGGILLSLLYHYGGQMAMTFAMHFVGSALSLMCLFSGVALTADAIAGEKREGTLGLLFLTHLSPFEIVLGKLIAHALVGFYTAFCALPLLSMSMIFGGMRFSDVLMYMVSALNALFFSSAIGLFVSSICRDRRRAGALGTLIVLFFWMGLPMLAVFANYVGAPGWLTEFLVRISLNLFNPFGAGMPRMLPSTSRFWSLVSPHVLGWAFFGLAIWMLPRRWHDEAPRKRFFLRDLWKVISLGTPATRLELRRRLLDRNAFMWLASRDRLQALGMWIGTFAVIAFFAFTILGGRLPPDLLIILAISLSIVQQVVYSGAAAVQLVREYEQGTLEMVLSTPFTVEEVIRGQFAAAIRHFRSAFAFTFVLLWAAILVVIVKYGGLKLRGIATLVVYSGFFALQFYAIAWVAMWSVVIAPDPKRANAMAFFYLLVFPGMLFGLILGCLEFLNWITGLSFWPPPEIIIAAMFALGFGNCIYWLRRAKRELPNRLRVFAFRRYTTSERPTLFGQIGKVLGRLWGRTRLRGPEPRISR